MLMLVLTVSVSSCKDDKDNDSVPPVIKVIKPISLDKFARGGMILIDADLSDNENLATLELSLSTQKAIFGFDTPWTPATQTLKLSGKSYQMRNQAAFGEIPSDIMSADYILVMKLSDAKGNTTTSTVTITIE